MKSRYYRSWHLARNEFEFKTTEFEWAMIRFHEAFARFVTTTGTVTMGGDIKFAEQLILHVIRMQDRPKNSATIARLINRDDIPNIQYSLRKLESAGLVKKSRDEKSKQFNYAVTELGARVTGEYHEIKAEILIERLKQIQNIEERLEDMAQLLSILTGVYEESSRDSATFTPMSGTEDEA